MDCSSWMMFVVILGSLLVDFSFGLPNILFVVVDDFGWNDISYHRKEAKNASDQNYGPCRIRNEDKRNSSVLSEEISCLKQ